MKTLHTRLDYQQEEVLKCTARYGHLATMEKFGIRDYGAFRRWLKEVAGDENFGMVSYSSRAHNETLGKQLVDAFLLKVAKLEAENEVLKARVKIMDQQLNERRHDIEELAYEALEICQV